MDGDKTDHRTLLAMHRTEEYEEFRAWLTDVLVCDVCIGSIDPIHALQRLRNSKKKKRKQRSTGSVPPLLVRHQERKEFCSYVLLFFVGYS